MAVLSPMVDPPYRPVDGVSQTAVRGSSTTGAAGRSSVTTRQTGIANALSGVPRERGPYPPSSARRRPRNSMVGPPPASSTSGGSEQWCRRGGGHLAKSRGPRANGQPRCSPTCGPRHRHRRLWPMSCTSRFACLSGSRTRPRRRRRICNTNCRGRGSQRQCSARLPRWQPAPRHGEAAPPPQAQHQSAAARVCQVTFETANIKPPIPAVESLGPAGVVSQSEDHDPGCPAGPSNPGGFPAPNLVAACPCPGGRHRLIGDSADSQGAALHRGSHARAPVTDSLACQLPGPALRGPGAMHFVEDR